MFYFEDSNENQINLEKEYSVENKEDTVHIESNPITFSSNNSGVRTYSTPFSELKKQNTILKWVCGGIAACLLFTICAFGSNVSRKMPTVYQSDGDRSGAIVTVKGNDKILTASEIYAENLDSVVAIRTEIVTRNIFNQLTKNAVAGSGFIISEDGYVLTNYHVVEKANKVTVTLSNGKEYDAVVVGSEADNDVAVLKLNTEDTFKPVTLGNSDTSVVGEEVVAIGNPLGELTFSITKGILSAKDREISTDLYTSINMLQVDCAVNEGNSGGPLFNMYGEVIGIVSAKYASNTIEGLGFCIPINDVAEIVTDLIANGKVIDKGSLGIQVSDLTESEIQKFNLVKGAYVYFVEGNSGAEKAGMQPGDIIVEFDGKKIENSNNLLVAKRNKKVGEKVNLKVWRDGEEIEMSVTLGETVEIDNEDLEEENNVENYEYYDNRDYENYENLKDLFRYFFGY